MKIASTRASPLMDRVLNPAPVRKLHVTNRPDRANNPVQAPGRNRFAGPAVGATAVPRFPQSGPAAAPVAMPMEAAPPPSGIRKLGLYSLAAFLFSGNANDLLHFVGGGKAYVSWIAGALMIVAFLGCGTSLRGLRAPVGRAWLGFAFFLVLATPFSIWRGESTELLSTYIPRVLFLFFYVTAFSVSLRDCRILVMTYIVCADGLLLSCALFGQVDEGGRFHIPDSLFFGGANELALGLVCALAFALYLVMQKSSFGQILGAGQFLLTLYFMVKTGSRGGFLALMAFLFVWILFSSQRLKLIALTIPAIAIIVGLSGSIVDRLIQIALPGNLDASSASGEAQESQVERTMLLRKSISFALHNPLFGTGPGTFRDALWNEDVRHATHTHSLGTHNSYAQVASECGFPAFFCYIFVVFGSIASNLRILKRTRGSPSAFSVYSMALTLFSSLIAFAVATFFDHVAYTGSLPILSGMSVALALASRNGDLRWIEAEAATAG